MCSYAGNEKNKKHICNKLPSPSLICIPGSFSGQITWTGTFKLFMLFMVTPSEEQNYYGLELIIVVSLLCYNQRVCAKKRQNDSKWITIYSHSRDLKTPLGHQRGYDISMVLCGRTAGIFLCAFSSTLYLTNLLPDPSGSAISNLHWMLCYCRWAFSGKPNFAFELNNKESCGQFYMGI